MNNNLLSKTQNDNDIDGNNNIIKKNQETPVHKPANKQVHFYYNMYM